MTCVKTSVDLTMVFLLTADSQHPVPAAVGVAASSCLLDLPVSEAATARPHQSISLSSSSDPPLFRCATECDRLSLDLLPLSDDNVGGLVTLDTGTQRTGPAECSNRLASDADAENLSCIDDAPSNTSLDAI